MLLNIYWFTGFLVVLNVMGNYANAPEGYKWAWSSSYSWTWMPTNQQSCCPPTSQNQISSQNFQNNQPNSYTGKTEKSLAYSDQNNGEIASQNVYNQNHLTANQPNQHYVSQNAHNRQGHLTANQPNQQYVSQNEHNRQGHMTANQPNQHYVSQNAHNRQGSVPFDTNQHNQHNAVPTTNQQLLQIPYETNTQPVNHNMESNHLNSENQNRMPTYPQQEPNRQHQQHIQVDQNKIISDFLERTRQTHLNPNPEPKNRYNGNQQPIPIQNINSNNNQQSYAQIAQQLQSIAHNLNSLLARTQQIYSNTGEAHTADGHHNSVVPIQKDDLAQSEQILDANSNSEKLSQLQVPQNNEPVTIIQNKPYLVPYESKPLAVNHQLTSPNSLNMGDMQIPTNVNSRGTQTAQPQNSGANTNNGLMQPQNLRTNTNNGLMQPQNLGTNSNNGLMQPQNLGANTNNGLMQPQNLRTNTNNGLMQPQNLGANTNNGLMQPQNLGANTNNGLMQPESSCANCPRTTGPLAFSTSSISNFFSGNPTLQSLSFAQV